jgi:hypothetical protein
MVKIQFKTPEGEVLTRQYVKGDVRIKKWLSEGWEEIKTKKETTKKKSTKKK